MIKYKYKYKCKHSPSNTNTNTNTNTHWGQDKIAAILQMTYSNAFYCKKIVLFIIFGDWYKKACIHIFDITGFVTIMQDAIL